MKFENWFNDRGSCLQTCSGIEKGWDQALDPPTYWSDAK